MELGAAQMGAQFAVAAPAPHAAPIPMIPVSYMHHPPWPPVPMHMMHGATHAMPAVHPQMQYPYPPHMYY